MCKPYLFVTHLFTSAGFQSRCPFPYSSFARFEVQSYLALCPIQGVSKELVKRQKQKRKQKLLKEKWILYPPGKRHKQRDDNDGGTLLFYFSFTLYRLTIGKAIFKKNYSFTKHNIGKQIFISQRWAVKLKTKAEILGLPFTAMHWTMSKLMILFWWIIMNVSTAYDDQEKLNKVFPTGRNPDGDNAQHLAVRF